MTFFSVSMPDSASLLNIRSFFFSMLMLSHLHVFQNASHAIPAEVGIPVIIPAVFRAVSCFHKSSPSIIMRTPYSVNVYQFVRSNLLSLKQSLRIMFFLISSLTASFTMCSDRQ